MKTITLPLALCLALAVSASAGKDEVTLPKGTSIELRVVTPVDSERAVKGGVFQAAVLHSLYAGGRLVIPRDAVVMGEISRRSVATGSSVWSKGRSWRRLMRRISSSSSALSQIETPRALILALVRASI